MLVVTPIAVCRSHKGGGRYQKTFHTRRLLGVKLEIFKKDNTLKGFAAHSVCKGDARDNGKLLARYKLATSFHGADTALDLAGFVRTNVLPDNPLVANSGVELGFKI